MSEQGPYDFIVVGSGPAGATVASRLSRTKHAPRVLLLEAGGPNSDASTRVLADRFTTLMTGPGMNWGYETVPQKHLDGLKVNYSRGKGLGGSSAINFAAYTIGPKDDYDEWARLVGDDAFNWENARRRFDALESYATDVPEAFRKYAAPDKAAHGLSGPLPLEFPNKQEWCFDEIIHACEDLGLPINKDINSGDPIGVGVVPSTARKSIRYTARTAFLEHPPSSLVILTDSHVERVVFEGKRAIGVVANGTTYLASKEVILSAGALDTPKLLKLSGVGPDAELSAHNIPTIQHLPGVGENLQDHALICLCLQVKKGLTGRPDLFNTPDVLAAARELFAKDGSGPLSVFYNSLIMGWQKLDALYDTDAFKQLPAHIQHHIRQPTVPNWELCALGPAIHPAADPAGDYLNLYTIQMTPQSRGRVTLASADARDAPLNDPNLFAHPFDRAAYIEAVRRTMRALNNPIFKQYDARPYAVPASESDEDIFDFIKKYVGTCWHMSGTAKMGRPEDEEAVVGTDFRVRGLQGLRIVDNSVLPFVLNCHVVSVAYLVGAAATEKLVAEYGFEEEAAVNGVDGMEKLRA